MPHFSIKAASQLLLILTLVPISTLAIAKPLNIVATIKPIQSLLANLTLGVSQPQLLIRGNQSPHTFSLRPSDARKLKQAQLVVWMGETLETSLHEKLPLLANQAHIVTLTDSVPQAVQATTEENKTPHSHDHHHSDQHSRDAHHWLSPIWAYEKIPVLVQALVQLDPLNEVQYRTNATLLGQRLQKLNEQIRHQILPIKNIPYIVSHDAYGHFEELYGLNNRGSITLSPERQPGAKRVAELTKQIKQEKIRCLYTEPQLQSKLAHKLSSSTAIKLGQLDPLGSALPEGPESYFLLLGNLTQDFISCLQ